MSKKTIEYDENGAAPCKHCLRKKEVHYPYVVDVDGLFYAKCPNCNYYDQFEFLGLTRKKAIRVWNETMENKSEFPNRRIN